MNLSLKFQLTIALYLKWYLKDKKDKLFGYTEHDSVLVLVWGTNCERFYKQTENFKEFDFLKLAKGPMIKKKKGSKIEPPPVPFEPEVWIYSFKDNDFIFETKGLYELLE